MSIATGIDGYYRIEKQIMNREEMVKYFAKHIKSGKVFRVGGEIGNMALNLIQAGLVNEKGKVNKYMLAKWYRGGKS